MSVGSGLVTSRRASLAGHLAGALAMGAVAMAGTTAAQATETLQVKTVISMPNGGKVTSFDISFVDPVTGLYLLGDRTNKGITVVDTASNTFLAFVGQGLFTGATGNNNTSGPDGVMVVNETEIWGGDGDSTLKFFSLADGGFLGQVDTFAFAVANNPKFDQSQGRTRVDEMCYDSAHNIGFVANNAATPPFITAVDVGTHTILGQIFFDGNNGTPNSSNGIEQCVFNPRDKMIYVTVPEINGPGDNTAAGGVSRIDPVANKVVATAIIPITQCSGPQGLAVGPVVGNFGEMLTGCNGSPAPDFAALTRSTALIDDGSQQGGTFGRTVELPFQAGNDMVTFNAADNHYYLARSGTNSFNNLTPDPVTGTNFGCPNVAGAINYGGDIFVGANAVNEAFGGPTFAGPQVLGMINARTLENDPDTITGLFNCPPGAPGPGGDRVHRTTVNNSHGGNHSVAADPAHNQIYFPVASTAFAPGMTGLCAQGGGTDALGCIAVFAPVGNDP